MPSPFDHLAAPKPDPIFGIALAAKRAGPEAIDATAGVYMDEDGSPLIFPSTKEALKHYGESLHKQDISYPPLLGLDEFRTTAKQLVFGDTKHHIANTASTGGTGALAINLRLLKHIHEDMTLIMPTPAWANHPPLVLTARLNLKEVPYIEDEVASITGVKDALNEMSGPSALLIQAGCHNPLGLDLSTDNWKELIDLVKEKDCIVLLDMAYQGFADEPENDAAIARKLADEGVHLLVTWSASKNHSIYGLRTGMAMAKTDSEEMMQTIEGYYTMISRGMHSAAPTAGQWIVNLVEQHEKDQWLEDLRKVRSLLKQKREVLLEHLPEPLRPALRGHGMFATLPLSLEQVLKLREEEKVYMLNSGRTNIAGVPLRRMEEFAQKIAKVYD